MIFSCASPTADTTAETAAADSLSGWYGEEFVVENAIPAAQLAGMELENGESGPLVVDAEILECCRKKGCWMRVDMGEGRAMRVTFKDYGFFVPLHADGRKVTMRGIAYYDTISVELLRHFAEDAGKSQEEIEAITAPELELSFEATGVRIH